MNRILIQKNSHCVSFEHKTSKLKMELKMMKLIMLNLNACQIYIRGGVKLEFVRNSFDSICNLIDSIDEKIQKIR